MPHFCSLASTFVSLVVPTLITLKILNSNDRVLLRSWIKLLLVLHLASQLPFASLPTPLSFLVKLWLFTPYSHGYSIVFNQFIEPFLAHQDPFPPTPSLSKSSKNSTVRITNTLILERYIDISLSLIHHSLLALGNGIFGFDNMSLRWHQRILKFIAPMPYRVLKRQYRKLKHVNSELRSLDRKYKRKGGFNGENKSPINEFFSNLNSYDKSGPSSKNLYVELLVLWFKESDSTSSIVNLVLSLAIFVVNFVYNISLLVFYKIIGKSVTDSTTGKKVSFVERALSYSSLKAVSNAPASKQKPAFKSEKPKRQSAANLSVPRIELTPASPVFPETIKTRPISKSVGSESSDHRDIAKELSTNVAIRKRRNSFKDLLKNKHSSSTSKISELASTGSNSSTLRSNSMRNSSTSGIGITSKVSTIEETTIDGSLSFNKDLFVKSLNDLSNTQKPSKILSKADIGPINTIRDEMNASTDSSRTGMASPLSLDSARNNENALSNVVADPFSAILNYSENSQSRDRSVSPVGSERRRSFMFFKKSENGIDNNLSSSELKRRSSDSKRRSTDSKRMSTDSRHGRNSINEIIKRSGFRKSISHETEPRDTTVFTEAFDTPSKIKEVNVEAYGKLTGSPLESEEPSFQSMTESSESVNKEIETSTPKSFAKASNNKHGRQISASSVGVKYVHSYTPNLDKVSKPQYDMSENSSIDYLAYQADDSNKEQYFRSPMHTSSEFIDTSVNLAKRKSLKSKFKKLTRRGN